MNDTVNNNGWVEGFDEDGAPCEYHIYSGKIRYVVMENAEHWEQILTKEEIEQLMIDGSKNPYSPMPTPIGKGFDEPQTICKDCNGTGEYKGLFITEDCTRCKGTGK